MPDTRRPARAAVKAARKAPTRVEASVFVLRKLRLLFNTVKGHFREVEKKAGVAGAQVWALSVVKAQPGIGVSDLARAMDVHQSTASNLLKPLIENGMVVADRADTDRRALRLRITPKGTAILRKAPGPATGVLPEVLSKLDLETLLRLDEDLEAVIALLDADRRSAKVPLGQPGA
jgi:DNA-binding MarR family transcriptional regulator